MGLPNDFVCEDPGQEPLSRSHPDPPPGLLNVKIIKGTYWLGPWFQTLGDRIWRNEYGEGPEGLTDSTEAASSENKLVDHKWACEGYDVPNMARVSSVTEHRQQSFLKFTPSTQHLRSDSKNRRIDPV